jgi:hypothetical protein
MAEVLGFIGLGAMGRGNLQRKKISSKVLVDKSHCASFCMTSLLTMQAPVRALTLSMQRHVNAEHARSCV